MVIDEVITNTNINYLADKKLYELSDGQFQKVMIARALVQETDFIILDEPTAHLDLSNKIEVMLLLREIAARGKGVLIATHDLQISLQLSDWVWLFNFNEPIVIGTPEDLVLHGLIEKGLFPNNHNVDLISGTVKVIKPTRGEITLSGDENVVFWTSQALKRNGFKITDEPVPLKVVCSKGLEWSLFKENEPNTYKSILDLTNHLIKISDYHAT
jgi:iron complex transport system ATP-binding protein